MMANTIVLWLKMTGVMASVVVLGWGVMKSTTPTTEQFKQRLDISEKDTEDIKTRNHLIFEKLEETSKDSEPFWKKP